MPVIDHHQVLKGLTVQEAMRRQVIQLPAEALLSQAIRAMIKFKVNAILVTGQTQEALGVVSKTDLMTAYYGGLPLETPVAEIMVGPPNSVSPRIPWTPPWTRCETTVSIGCMSPAGKASRSTGFWPFQTLWVCCIGIVIAVIAVCCNVGSRMPKHHGVINS